MKYKVGIIGAGRIGALYDDPMSSMTLTHAHAVTRSHKFDLQGFWDLSAEASQFAAERWNVKAYHSMENLCRDSDVIIVATPDEFHENILKEILRFNLKLVICEKPLTLSYSSAFEITALYKKKKIPLYVNFQRRFDSTVINFRDQYIAGRFGKPMGGTIWYSKGINHNGSHAIDMLRYLFGEPLVVEAHSKIYDYYENDPTVNGRLDFGEFSIYLMAGNERYFSLFELDLMFQKSRYRFTHSGFDLEIQMPAPDTVFSGYKELRIEENIKSDLPLSLIRFIDYIGDVLDKNISGFGTLAEDALLTQRICGQLSGG